MNIMNIASYLENSAERLPEKAAINFEGQNITYHELNKGCNRLANGLTGLGLMPGDRCLVMMPNSIDIVQFNAFSLTYSFKLYIT